jgi:hypothetical protein
MLARSQIDLHNIRLGVERIKRLSDRLVGLGPFGVGLDGILSFTPVAGAVYSAASGALLVLNAIRARASPGVIVQMSGLLLINTLLDLPGGTPVGIFSGIADTLWTAHKWSADILLKHMDETLYVEGSKSQATAHPEYEAVMRDIRSGKEKRRVVFLR